MGTAGRLLVEAKGSLTAMVRGYEQLIRRIYDEKSLRNRGQVTADLAQTDKQQSLC
jgi:hypothetical protein